MSASPAAAAGGSTKRPFEEEPDQPDAKRQALDKPKSDEEATDDDKPAKEETEDAEKEESKDEEVKADTEEAVTANGHAESNGIETETDTETKVESTVEAQLQLQPIPTTAVDTAISQAQPAHQQRQDESQFLHVRAVISSAEAATVIGKGGENVSQIRRHSGAKCTVSDYSRGAVERILTVSGMVDAVAKAFGLIIRTLNNEPLGEASTPQSKTYPLRLLIPHLLIGSIIGKGGGRIREIQEASGARLNASDATLPLSTERSLVVLGVADAVHIATYYVGQTLVEQLTERFGGPAASAYANRHGQAAGAVPGGMQVVPYVPQAAHGQYLHPDNFRRHSNSASRTPANPYGIPYLHGQPPQQQQQPSAQPQQPQQQQQPQQPQQQQQQQPQTPIHYQPPQQHGGGYAGAGPHQPHAQQAAHQAQPGLAGPPMQPQLPGQPLTQQIYIPNDMVGAIIGKGGAKINEIRQLSGSVIKINEPQDNSNERLVTITGTQECNQMALYMLYSRLESEKHRM